MPELTDHDLAPIRAIDPAAGEEPPAPGSARYNDILRRATGPARKGRSWRWPLTGAAAAAVVAVVTVVAVSAGGPPAGELVLVAADTTATVGSLRGVTEVVTAGGERRSSTIEVAGDDMRLVTRDGPVTITSVVVDGRFYERVSDDPEPRTGELTPESSLDSFAESTGAVVRAAVQNGDVKELGEEKIRGAEATHYRLKMTPGARAALTALPAGQTAWFELEHADEIASIDVWAAGDLIRRVAVDRGETRSTTDFFDFNAPITVTVPPGF